MTGSSISVLVIVYCLVVFGYLFFSSRRRHTRCLSDWSSDVCSSDLSLPKCGCKGPVSASHQPYAAKHLLCRSARKGCSVGDDQLASHARKHQDDGAVLRCVYERLHGTGGSDVEKGL